jgi:hypothetical protein
VIDICDARRATEMPARNLLSSRHAASARHWSVPSFAREARLGGPLGRPG